MTRQVFMTAVGGAVVVVGLSIVAAGYIPKANHSSPPSPEGAGHLDDTTVVDLSNPRVLLGYVQNVFAAKVQKEVSRISRPHSSDIQYDAEVIYNIKGNAQGNVVVDLDDSDGASLIPGATYLFAALHIEEMSPWYYLGSDSAKRTLISEDGGLFADQLLDLVKRNERTYELLNAYPNEIVRYTGKDANLAVNSFQSLSSDQKQAIYAKFQGLIPPRPVPAILPPPPPPPPPPPSAKFQENSYSLCHDGIDNDGDGLTDAQDPGCAAFYPSKSTPPPAPSSLTPQTSSTTNINAPAISNITTVVATSSVTITWTTNTPSTSQFFYGTTTAMGANSIFDPALVTSHSRSVSALTPSTTYYYQVQSYNPSGAGNSAQQSFTTLGQ